MEKLKEFWDKLTTHEKVALGVLVAGVAGYAFYKKSKAGSSSSNAMPSVGQPVDQYGNPLYPTNLSGVYSQQPGGSFSTGTGGTATQALPSVGTVRQAIGTSQYDKQYGGVAVFATPATNAGGGHNTGFVPFGSSVQILGQAQGTPYGGVGGSGSSLYYLTPQGYINSQDVTFS